MTEKPILSRYKLNRILSLGQPSETTRLIWRLRDGFLSRRIQHRRGSHKRVAGRWVDRKLHQGKQA